MPSPPVEMQYQPANANLDSVAKWRPSRRRTAYVVAVVSIMFVGALPGCAVANSTLTERIADSHDLKDRTGQGIWKSAVPPVAMRGEFDSHDPIGLANRQLIKADCSINWTDPDTARLYCFSVPTSLAYFLYWPKRNIARASHGWEWSTRTRFDPTGVPSQ